MSFSIYLQDETATVQYGLSLGRVLHGGAIVYLEGKLGAGKTTLCRGVLSAFGHSGAVKSPTYTLVEPYALGETNVYHFDLYRLGDPEELEFIGVRDYFVEENISLIEWPTKGHGFIPAADICARLNPEGEGRKLVIESETERGAKILSLLKE